MTDPGNVFEKPPSLEVAVFLARQERFQNVALQNADPPGKRVALAQ